MGCIARRPVFLKREDILFHSVLLKGQISVFLKSSLKFKWEGKEAPNNGKKCL